MSGDYARVYHYVMDDTKFDGIREDMRLFGSWTMLLVVADMAYPVPAFIPPTVPRSAVVKLTQAELIDVLPGHRYRVRGLAAERERRTESARAAGLASARARGVERPLDERSTTDELAKQSRAEQRQAEQPARDPAECYWSLTGRFPNEKALAWIDQLTGEYGAEAVIAALAECHRSDPSVSSLIGRAQDQVRSKARQLDQKERKAELERVAANRRVNVPLLIARHNSGQHLDTEPDCPACRQRGAA